MIEYRNIEAVKKGIEQNIEDIQCRILAWDNVKRVYRKDGSEYKTLSRNFKNCRFESDKIYVYYMNGHAHESDWIKIDYNMAVIEVENAINKRIESEFERLNCYKSDYENIEAFWYDISLHVGKIKGLLKFDGVSSSTKHKLKDIIKSELHIL